MHLIFKNWYYTYQKRQGPEINEEDVDRLILIIQV